MRWLNTGADSSRAAYPSHFAQADADHSIRLLRRFVIGVVLAMCLVPTLFSLSGSDRMLAASFHDDAYYYFRIAENIAAGNGSTFDGLNLTNGYQPLWCWLLVPVAALKIHLFPQSYLQLYGAGIALLATLIALLVFNVSAYIGGTLAAIVATTLLLFGRVQTLFTGGMEATILGVFLLLYVWLLVRQEMTRNLAWILGLVGGGSF